MLRGQGPHQITLSCEGSSGHHASVTRRDYDDFDLPSFHSGRRLAGH